MKRLYDVPDDFEALIRVFSTEEGGRFTPPFNGIRWDFGYADDPSGSSIYMIWPDFFDAAGDSLPTDKPLPIGPELPARMTILADELRTSYHREHIQIGTHFFCHEGSKRVATGHVSRITGLLHERPNPKSRNA